MSIEQYLAWGFVGSVLLVFFGGCVWVVREGSKDRSLLAALLKTSAAFMAYIIFMVALSRALAVIRENN